MANNVVVPEDQAIEELDALTGGTDFTDAKLHLSKTDFTPSVESVLADFTPADYTGYAAKTITWSPAFFDSTGDVISSGGEHLFKQTGATGCNVYCFYITDTAGTKLLRSGRLPDAPWALTNEDDVLPVLVKIGIDFGYISVAPTP